MIIVGTATIDILNTDFLFMKIPLNAQLSSLSDEKNEQWQMLETIGVAYCSIRYNWGHFLVGWSNSF